MIHEISKADLTTHMSALIKNEEKKHKNSFTKKISNYFFFAPFVEIMIHTNVGIDERNSSKKNLQPSNQPSD